MIAPSPAIDDVPTERFRSRSFRVLDPFLESLAAVVIALVVCGAVLAISGHNPFAVYGELVQRTLLRPAGIEESLVRATPLLIASAAVLLAARAGLWNIGIDGQVLIGALAAATVGASLDGFPAPVLWSGALAVALLAGGAWAAVPALLRAKWQVNEIVTTIMFNYVALSLTSWLVKGPLRDESLVSPQTPLIPRDLRFPGLADTRIHAGIILALAVWAVLGWWLSRTVAGFELRAVGLNPRAARHAMIPVVTVVAVALVASGAIAALAGGNDVLSTKGTFQGEWSPEYGLSAFAIVFLARRNMLALPLAALFMGMLAYGADVMPRAADIPSMFFTFFEGVLLVILASFHWRPWARWTR
jgi:simple sugar transport system permease protein